MHVWHSGSSSVIPLTWMQWCHPHPTNHRRPTGLSLHTHTHRAPCLSRGISGLIKWHLLTVWMCPSRLRSWLVCVWRLNCFCGRPVPGRCLSYEGRGWWRASLSTKLNGVFVLRAAGLETPFPVWSDACLCLCSLVHVEVLWIKSTVWGFVCFNPDTSESGVFVSKRSLSALAFSKCFSSTPKMSENTKSTSLPVHKSSLRWNTEQT